MGTHLMRLILVTQVWPSGALGISGATGSEKILRTHSSWAASEPPPVYDHPGAPGTKPSLHPCLIFSLNFTYSV